MDAVVSESNRTLVRARGVEFSYGEAAVLRGVDLQVSAAEVVALTGPSGCGKSTLLYCLAGLLVPAAGKVSVAGHWLNDLDDDERAALRRTECGFVFQFGELVPELTLLDNVALILEVNGVSRAAALRQAQQLLDELDIGHVADHLPAKASGGQVQRAALARAVVHQPSVVFADEPTGSVDQANAGRVLAQLLGLARARGCAVVLVSHDADVVRQADRVLELHEGVISA